MAKIKEILGKVLKGEDLTDTEKETLRAWEEPDIEAIANARAKSARQDAEKKLEQAQKEKAELQTKMEEMQNSDLSELDKMKKEFEKLTNANATMTEQLGQETKKNEQLLRGHKIDEIVGKMKFIDGYSPEDARIILAHKLNDVDFTDQNAVDAKVAEFQTANKGVLVADTGGGAGSHSGGNAGDVNIDTKTFTKAEIAAMPTEEFLKNEDAIWKAQNEGRINE